jgi:membrane associated rhomboid family serine protease
LRRPPSFTTQAVLAAPVIVSVGALATVATLAWASAKDVSWLFSDFGSFLGEPWRLLTSVLPHINLVHLAFNLYWLWVFGTLIENTFGHVKTCILIFFLAAGSSGIAGVFGEDGVGLSGVVYGFFGLLLILRNRDDRFRDAMSWPTVPIFVGWFFFCIVLTLSGALPIGNIAHGAGWALGVMFGLAVAQRWRWPALAGIASSILVLALGIGWLWRPYLNIFGGKQRDFAMEAYYRANEANRCLELGDDNDAVRLYRQAVELDKTNAGYWFNLGVSYQRLKRFSEAQACYERASDLKPQDQSFRAARDALRSFLSATAGKE